MNGVIEGNLVDVRHKEVFPARITHEDGIIASIERVPGDFEGYIIPGLIDSHIHIESSLLCPSRFAEVVVPSGTTSVVTDPHEIANVLGLNGVDYMVRDSKTVPLRTYFTAPSCVPATPFETSGAAFGPEEIENLLARLEFVALGEMMNYPGAVAHDPDVMVKLAIAKKYEKPVDGHCPLLTGEELKEYVSLGISTDHECTSSAEAKEKYSLGMLVMVRQGSASRNLEALAPFAMHHEFLLVSDDKSASDLMHGHVNKMLAEAVKLGIEPMHALRAATINPAVHYKLAGGVIEPGRYADMVRVNNLEEFKAEEVYIGGQLVAANGSAKFEVKPKEMVNQFVPQRKTPSSFELFCGQADTEVRAIGVLKNVIVTETLSARLRAENSRIVPDLANDVQRIAVVNRYKEAPAANAFVKGFGLSSGAIASTVAHDSHNVIVVGVGSDDMAVAVNTLINEGGGFCVCSRGKAWVLNLHIAGLMCTKPAFDVMHSYEQLLAKARELGCRLDDPFMTLSFLSLLVIPTLKIGDKGLFDVTKFEFVPPVISHG